MIAASAPKVLNIGCGRLRMPDAINLDVTDRTNPDVVHDLNCRPWPFDDNRFEVVHARDIIEHLHDTVAVMEEIHRVCHPGAIVHLTLADGTRLHLDPQVYMNDEAAMSLAYERS